MPAAKNAPRLHAVRVRVREIPYVRVGQNALGDPQIIHETGYGPGHQYLDPAHPNNAEKDEDDALQDFKLGELVDLNDEDYLRLRAAGAVVDADDVLALGEGNDVELVDVRTASVDDLADWIRQEGPTINEVVAASEGEPDLAQKLLEAENDATDGDPRKGVVDGLSSVISRG